MHVSMSCYSTTRCTHSPCVHTPIGVRRNNYSAGGHAAAEPDFTDEACTQTHTLSAHKRNLQKQGWDLISMKPAGKLQH